MTVRLVHQRHRRQHTTGSAVADKLQNAQHYTECHSLCIVSHKKLRIAKRDGRMGPYKQTVRKYIYIQTEVQDTTLSNSPNTNTGSS